MNPCTTWTVGTEIPARAMRAHEMKNCVSVILAIARLVESELSHESRARLERLQLASRRLRDLVLEDLHADGGAVRSAAREAACSVTSLVEETSHRVFDRAAAANVKLVVECAGGELHCDERALREALFNIVVNAIEATPSGGAVFVTTRVTKEGDQRWVIRDTGEGIAPDRLAELGRPFRSTKTGGSGVRFNFAQGAVAAHGGRLHVKSDKGAGTTVSIWLPARPTAARP